MTFRSLLIESRSEPEHFYTDEVRNLLPQVLLEAVHAISRGRMPSSSSFLPGKNLRRWLTTAYTEEQENLHDDFGDKCSYVTDFEEELTWLPMCDYKEKMFAAIKLCRRLVYRQKRPLDCRGDWNYQELNRSTKKKRRIAYVNRDNVSVYEGEYRSPEYYTSIFSPPSVRRARRVTGTHAES